MYILLRFEERIYCQKLAFYIDKYENNYEILPLSLIGPI